MRDIGKRQGINKWSNGWSWSTDFQRRKSKCKIKCEDINKDNNLNHLNLFILFVIYKRQEVEIRHEQSWYDKEQLPSLTSTQLVLFDEVHIQQVSGPPVTSKVLLKRPLRPLSTLVSPRKRALRDVMPTTKWHALTSRYSLVCTDHALITRQSLARHCTH